MITPIKTIQAFENATLRAKETPEQYWEEIANTFTWKKKWDTVLDWDFKDYNVQWFEGAQLNIVDNCVDRHAISTPNKTAFIWEPNSPNDESIKLTYKELQIKVNQLANGLRELGMGKGDRVAIYMPMILELPIAMLACAKIGAVHSVVFGGFSEQALADRINHAEAKLVITAKTSKRGAKSIPLLEMTLGALEKCDNKPVVLSVDNGGHNGVLEYQALTEKQSETCVSEVMTAEDPLFILYTSGSTGTPKGIVHTCGGYMVYTEYSFQNVFQYEEGDTYWCSADCGWITGHSYITYGPLLAGASVLIFEGIPTYPTASRMWEIIDKYKVNQFYTAPTAIRALMKYGEQQFNDVNLKSLKTLGTVGEPINHEAWEWFYRNVGASKLPIVDTWWQTETGGIMISNLAGVTPAKSSFATKPLPGIQPVLLDEKGNEITDANVEGALAVKYPWPSMLRTTWGDHERCKTVYFSDFSGFYFTGDSALRDENGNYRIIGRMDDVINVSGHRIGTAEIENVIDEHPDIIEAAVVGKPHEIKGQSIIAFVTLASDNPKELLRICNEMLVKEIGPFAKCDDILVCTGLPKTRSGKIMRRILRKIANGDTSFGDISTLLNPEVVAEIQQNYIKAFA